MCEAQERNQRAIYQLEGMARNWAVDVPQIIRTLKGDQCEHPNHPDEPSTNSNNN